MEQVNTAAEQILGYLQTHPHACDTLEGIAAWWLLRHRIASSLTEVQQVIKQLVAEGVVKQNLGPDGRTTYSLQDDASAD